MLLGEGDDPQQLRLVPGAGRADLEPGQPGAGQLAGGGPARVVQLPQCLDGGVERGRGPAGPLREGLRVGGADAAGGGLARLPGRLVQFRGGVEERYGGAGVGEGGDTGVVGDLGAVRVAQGGAGAFRGPARGGPGGARVGVLGVAQRAGLGQQRADVLVVRGHGGCRGRGLRGGGRDQALPGPDAQREPLHEGPGGEALAQAAADGVVAVAGVEARGDGRGLAFGMGEQCAGGPVGVEAGPGTLRSPWPRATRRRISRPLTARWSMSVSGSPVSVKYAGCSARISRARASLPVSAQNSTWRETAPRMLSIGRTRR